MVYHQNLRVVDNFGFQILHDCSVLSRFVLNCWGRVFVFLWRRWIQWRSPGREPFELRRIFIIVINKIRRWIEKDSFGIITEFEL